MKSIDNIRHELRKIPHAMWMEETDSSRKPHGLRNDVNNPLYFDKGFASNPIDMDLNTEWDYPDWVEQEIFQGLDRGIGKDGIDALAWYVSFHVSSDSWGIFLPISSFAYIEVRYLRKLRRNRYEKWNIAREILIEHELFHFATDYAVSQWEIMMKSPSSAWLHNKILKESQEGCLEIEEKLANAYMLRTLWDKWPVSVKDAIGHFVGRQPKGYRDAAKYIEDSRFAPELSELIKHYIGLHTIEKDLNILNEAFDCATSFPALMRIDGSQCPITIIHDEKNIGIQAIQSKIIKCMPKIVETDRFQRDFRKLDKPLQKRWKEVKGALSEKIPSYPDFEKLKGKRGEMYSLRLNDNFRVHVRPRGSYDIWEAVGVGTHKRMGHG